MLYGAATPSILPTPPTSSSITFRIHSEPKNMLYKNARKAFTDALLSDKIFGLVGSIGPVTEFTPQARRSLPPRLGGTSSDVRGYGEELENMITAAAAYHARLDMATLSSSRGPSLFDTALQEAVGTPEQQPRRTRDHEPTHHPEGQAKGRQPDRQAPGPSEGLVAEYGTSEEEQLYPEGYRAQEARHLRRQATLGTLASEEASRIKSQSRLSEEQARHSEEEQRGGHQHPEGLGAASGSLPPPKGKGPGRAPQPTTLGAIREYDQTPEGARATRSSSDTEPLDDDAEDRQRFIQAREAMLTAGKQTLSALEVTLEPLVADATRGRDALAARLDSISTESTTDDIDEELTRALEQQQELDRRVANAHRAYQRFEAQLAQQQKQLDSARAVEAKNKTPEAVARRTSARLAGLQAALPGVEPPRRTGKAAPTAPYAGPLLRRHPVSPLRGDGSERGPDDSSLAPSSAPTRVSRLSIPGSAIAYDGVEGAIVQSAHSEIRDMRAALDIQHSHANNVAVLDRARSSYPMIARALRARMAMGLAPGSIHTLPIAAVSVLAEAQRQQEIARIIIMRSASGDSSGGKRGTALADLLRDKDLYDSAAARVIANSNVTVDILVIELIAGIIPHASIALILAEHYHAGGATQGALLYAAAEAAVMSNEKGLNITEGCREFFKLYAHAQRFEQRISVAKIFKALVRRLTEAAHAQFQDSERNWSLETTAWLRTISRREHVDDGGPEYTRLELDKLVDYIREFGERHDEMERDLLRTKDGERVCVTTTFDDEDDSTLRHELHATNRDASRVYAASVPRNAMVRPLCDNPACTSKNVCGQ